MSCIVYRCPGLQSVKYLINKQNTVENIPWLKLYTAYMPPYHHLKSIITHKGAVILNVVGRWRWSIDAQVKKLSRADWGGGHCGSMG